MSVESMRRAASPRSLSLPPPRPSETANDNSLDRPPVMRSVWRELLFLGILAASLYGAFVAGRSSGYQKVIVVPGPIGFYSIVT